MKWLFHIGLSLIPEDWRRVVALCTRLRLVSPAQTVKLAMLAFFTVVTEVFGLFMILPVLQFTSENQNLAKLASQSRLWAVVSDVSRWTGLPITLASLCILVFLLICLRQAAQYAFTIYLARVQEDVVKRLRSQMFDALLRSRGAHVDALGSGTYVNTIGTSCHYGGTAIASLAKLGVVLLSFVAYGAGLLLVAPTITAIAIASAVVLGYAMRRFRNATERLGVQMIRRNEELLQFLSERFRAWRLIKFSDTRQAENDAFIARAGAVGALVVIAKTTALVQLLLTPAGAVLMLGGLYLSVEYFRLTVAELTLFVLIYLRIIPLTSTILAGRQQLAIVAADLAQAKRQLREAKVAREIDLGTRAFEGVCDSIVFRDIVFHHPNHSIPALDGVTVKIPGHATTALTGPSGGGKSTLVDLLPRYSIRRAAGS